MEVITIIVQPGGVQVVDGRVKSARLKYHAPGLHIYVFGAVPLKMRDKVHYHACEQARARHIPLTMLKSQGWV